MCVCVGGTGKARVGAEGAAGVQGGCHGCPFIDLAVAISKVGPGVSEPARLLSRLPVAGLGVLGFELRGCKMCHASGLSCWEADDDGSSPHWEEGRKNCILEHSPTVV